MNKEVYLIFTAVEREQIGSEDEKITEVNKVNIMLRQQTEYLLCLSRHTLAP